MKPPPVPRDLEILLENDYWLHHYLEFSLEFVDAFQKNDLGVSRWCQDWTRDPCYDEQKASEELEQLDFKVIRGCLDGYMVRKILDTAFERWREPTLQYLKLYAHEDARTAVLRVKELDSSLQPFDDFLNSNSASLFPKLAAVATQVRYWRYQEIYILRYELWQRWGSSHLQLLEKYQAGDMSWRKCWYGDREVLHLIDTYLQKLPPILHPGSDQSPEYSHDDESEGEHRDTHWPKC